MECPHVVNPVLFLGANDEGAESSERDVKCQILDGRVHYSVGQPLEN